MLQIGDSAPDITLYNDRSDPVRLHDYILDKPLVLFFYPKDFTPGCTTEACNFQRHFSEFNDLDANVVGVSHDSIKSHQKFKRNYGLTYDLLSDPDHIAEKAFGVPRNIFGLIPGRVTFVIDQTATIRFLWDSARKPISHIHETLKYLKHLQSKGDSENH